MARGVRVALFALTAVTLLASASPASAASPRAASPQAIYRDLADNGRLDHHYSKADINRALHMPSLRRYEVSSGTPQSITTPLQIPSPPVEKARAIPFTGVDLALFFAVGGPLLLLGAGLGRLVRLRQQELPS
jgi:hypothetical protein